MIAFKLPQLTCRFSTTLQPGLHSTTNRAFSQLTTMSLILQSVSVLLLLTYTLDQYLSSPHSSTKEIPGPFHTRYTSLALLLHVFRGRRRVWIHQLHQTYGPVVRLGPKEVSVTGGEALKEVYCKGGGWEKGRFYELFRIGGRR
jgi:hypothetical protein